MRLFTLLFLLYLPSLQAQIARYEYYADLPFWESPIQIFQGESPLSREVALQRNHIQVGFDKLNRIVDIQSRSRGEFKELAFSLYIHAVHTKISYQEGMATHRFFDRFGNQISSWGEVWEKRYAIDELGRFTSLTLYDETGKQIENQHGYASFEWEYPGDGSVIESRYSLNREMKTHRPGFEFERIKMFFAPDQTLRLMQNIDEEGNLVESKSGAAQYRYFYNPRGTFSRWEVLDKNGKPALGPTGTAGEYYKFTDYTWAQIAFFDKDEKPTKHASGAVNWHAGYDKYGNMTARWFSDETGTPETAIYGYHKVIWTFSEDGLHLLKKHFVDVDGKPVVNRDGVAVVNYIRDKSGNLIREENRDIHGELVNDAWFKHAYKTYSYSAQGKRLGTLNFDAEGNEI